MSVSEPSEDGVKQDLEDGYSYHSFPRLVRALPVRTAKK